MKNFCDAVQLVCGLVVWGLLALSIVSTVVIAASQFYAMHNL